MSVPESKDRLLAAAKALFLARGYHGTTVDAICESAGLTKGSFYHFFSSKEDLGAAVLNWSLERSGALLADGPFASITDPVARALGYLSHVEASSKELWSGGCLLGTFAVELAETNPNLQKAVAGMFDAVASDVATQLEPLAETWPGDDTPTAAELAAQFLMILEGAITLAKAYRDWTRIPKAIGAYRKSLEAAVTVTS
jgi:TetR/AcrR family transcriptional repressor of nem operon